MAKAKHALYASLIFFLLSSILFNCKTRAPRSNQSEANEFTADNIAEMPENSSLQLFYEIDKEDGPFPNEFGIPKGEHVVLDVDLHYLTVSPHQEGLALGGGIFRKPSPLEKAPKVADVIKNPDFYKNLKASKALTRIVDSEIGKNNRPISKSAIVPAGSTVYRGMNIDPGALNILLKNGIDAPVFFHAEKATSSEAGLSFQARALTVDIWDHMFSSKYGSQSIFLSTTKNMDIALMYGGRKVEGREAVVFNIVVPKNKAIDVSDALKNELQSQSTNKTKKAFAKNVNELEEVDFIGKIYPENIIGYWKLNEKGEIQEYITLPPVVQRI